MTNSFSFEKSKPSEVKRLPFLPRIGITIDFAGKQISFRQAPFLETLVNLWGSEFSLKNLVDVASKQLREIQLHEFSAGEKRADEVAAEAQTTDVI